MQQRASVMCLIRVRLDYGSTLWLEDWDYKSRNEYNGVVVDINTVGIFLSLKIDIDKVDKIGIAKGLQNSIAPLWQDIPTAQHQTLIDIASSIYEATDRVDMALRSISKCYRLPAPQYSKFFLNQQPYCDEMTWILDDADRNDLEEILNTKREHDRVVGNKTITLPFPINFNRKHISLNSEEVKKFEVLVDTAKVIPYKQMFSEAYARFTVRQNNAAVLMLATSAETALKSYISDKGGSLLQYMLDKMASPSLENLFVASMDHCGLNVPERFKKWLSALREKRNEIAHKSTFTNLDPLEIGRWIAVVEAIMSAIDGVLVNSYIGEVVTPIGLNASEKFSLGTVGVILRMEPYASMPPYHVLMSTGETYRMNEASFKVLPKHKFKTFNNQLESTL